jgi:hypothetical protein
MKVKYSLTINKKKETGINLEKYENLKSVKEFKSFLDEKKYYSIREYNKKMYADSGTTRQRMTIQMKLCDLDLDYDIIGELDDVIERLQELKKEYKDQCWGKIILDNEKDFWQGNYEGEDWTLLHEYKELDSDFKKRMSLLDKIEKEISTQEKRKKTNKEKKEYEKFLELKNKFEGGQNV